MTLKRNVSNVRERDALTGRFKKKLAAQALAVANSTAIVETQQLAASVTSKPQPKNLNSQQLFRFFHRSKVRNPIYVRVLERSLCDVRDAYGSIIQPIHTLSHTDLMINNMQNYDYRVYVNFSPLQGNSDSRYFDNSHQFILFAEGDEGYDEIYKAFESVRLANIYRNLHHDFTIGCDPEVFVEKKEGGLIPAFMFLPSKERPTLTANNRDGGRLGNFNGFGGCTMYWDGYQAEFTTKAQTCLGHHCDSIAAGLTGVYRAANEKFPGAKLSMRSVFHIDPEALMSDEDEHVAFGCMPSFNVYGLKVNMPPAREVPFRSAGGHIHFGTNRLTHAQAEPMVKALDAILGVACVSLFAEFDDPNRRKLYGLPGEYRLPPHGLEYRPLSNAWLSHPMITNLVIDLARKCVVFGRKNLLSSFWKTTEEETIDTIIRCDVETSHKILERNREVLKQLLKASYQRAGDSDLETLFNVFKNGIGSAIKNPRDFETNWKFKTGWIAHYGGAGEPNVATFMSNRRHNPKYLM